MSFSERQGEVSLEKVSDMKSVKEGSTSGSRKRTDYERREEERKKKEKADTTPVTNIVNEDGIWKHPYYVFIMEYVEKNHTDNKPLPDVFAAGKTKWNSMSSSEKAPYVEKSDLKYFEEQFKKENEELVEALEYYKNKYGIKDIDRYVG